MRVFVVGSGSSGNALIIEASGQRLVIDAGVNPTAMATRMHSVGVDIFPSTVVGIVVTHHHGDHIARARPLQRAFKVPLHLHDGIDHPVLRAKADIARYVPGERFDIGPFAIEATPLPHDAPQVALRVEAEGVSFGIATDLGEVPPDLDTFIGACDAALVEANHCPKMLSEGPYPWHLKRRVASNVGRLSNQQCAELISRLPHTRLRRVYLGHLSRVNNTPERALETVKASARGLPVEVIPHGAVRAIDVVGALEVLDVAAAKRHSGADTANARQLAFSFSA